MFIGDVTKWMMVYFCLWIAFSVSTHITNLSAYAQDPHSEPFASEGPPEKLLAYMWLYFYVALGEDSGWEGYLEPHNNLIMGVHPHEHHVDAQSYHCYIETV